MTSPAKDGERRSGVELAFRYGLAAAVAVAWIASFAIELASATGIAPTGYRTPATVHVLMGIVVGSAGGDIALRRVRRKIADQVAGENEEQPR